ncbi:MAG: formylglycine-generating enzyme family protein [Victivallales bacterium]|nr:formylglycine-generating enzyme family protein [Victivallales bacterium]
MKNAITVFAILAVAAVLLHSQALPQGPYKTTYPNGAVIELLPIKAGSYTMGSPATELVRFPDEVQHEVKIEKDFWMGKTEVTQLQWDAVMGTNPERYNQAWYHGDALPMENVSWMEANEFCRRLTEQEKKAKRIPENAIFRLPTEAEWEYACRAGTTTAFNNGKDFLQKGTNCPELAEVATFRFNSGGKRGRFNRTKQVATRRPNAWGLLDMHGNVAEWCDDNYTVITPPVPETEKKSKKAKKQESEVVNDKASQKIIRGGSFMSMPQFCRAAYRGSAEPVTRNNTIGFRVVLSTVQPPAPAAAPAPAPAKPAAPAPAKP